jgi:glycosyltransferase involved in cell wall biosynthesis
VVPVLNGEAHIAEQLAALAAQTYTQPWEVVVVDNGCTDLTMTILDRWRDRLPELIIADARQRSGLNYARSAGASAARGDFLAFCDADDVVTPSWLEALADAAPHSDLVGGREEREALNDAMARAWHGGSRPPMTDLHSDYRFMPYVSGGNCGVWTGVARQIGWDESFSFGASDIEFAWRAQLAGFRASFQSAAVVQVRYRTATFALMKQFFRRGASEPHLFRCFRDSGMPRHGLLFACGSWAWLVLRFPRALRRREVRGNWLRIAASNCGRLWGSIRWRALYL